MVAEEVLEAEAIELDALDSGRVEASALPAEPLGGGVVPWREEVRSAALAAAGGIVAGAATVAAVKAVARPNPKRAGRGLLRRERPREIVASRSFLVDVHLLGR